jgi:hypothetical protein
MILDPIIMSERAGEYEALQQQVSVALSLMQSSLLRRQASCFSIAQQSSLVLVDSASSTPSHRIGSLFAVCMGTVC